MGIDAEMFVRIRHEVSSKELRRRGVDHFFIYRPGSEYGPEEGQHCLEFVDEYEQDGPTITPEKGETFVQVHLQTRYYGPGYERGNLPLILNVARFLRVTFAPCEVWYGGDSSGVIAEHLDDALEAQLFAHFAGERGRAYFANSGSRRERPRCDFCDVDLAGYGGGSDGGELFYCNGCGQHLSVKKGVARSFTDRFGYQVSAGKEDAPIPRADLEDYLLRAVAALSLKETRVTHGSFSHDRETGRQLHLSIQTSWHLLTPSKRAQTFERVLERLGERAKQELDGQVKP